MPVPDAARSEKERDKTRRALDYMALAPGARLQDTPIDAVFIGSCTNGRIEDLRAASVIVKGRKVADHVTALVVPGSGQVKRQAEAEGLDRIFLDAGFEWREAGCSLCVAMNNDRLEPGKRCASTSNRNFEGRQGIGRAHASDEPDLCRGQRHRGQAGRRAGLSLRWTRFTHLKGVPGADAAGRHRHGHHLPRAIPADHRQEGARPLRLLRTSLWRGRDRAFGLRAEPAGPRGGVHPDRGGQLPAAAQAGSRRYGRSTTSACVASSQPGSGEIFQANCFKNGMLALTVKPDNWARVMQDAEEARAIEVDLEGQVIRRSDGEVIIFHVPELTREALLNGWDEIDLILRQDGETITGFEERQRAVSPWLYQGE